MSAKNKIAENIEIEGELLNFVSYSTYYNRQPLFTSFKISNGGDDLASLKADISCSTSLLLPSSYEIEELARGSSVEIEPNDILNPKYLAELEKPEECTVTVSISCGKNVLCTLSAQVSALPVDCWAGLSGNAESLAPFVRPKLADCQKILAEAGLQLRTWGYSSEFTGYAGNDKNAVRSAAAAVFAALRRQNLEREETPDLTAVNCIGGIAGILQRGSANAAEAALFAASCFEAVRLHPLILIGKKFAGVGVWLYESCFSTSVQDDMLLVEKYTAEGVNNIAVFDAGDLFAHKNASYSTSEEHARGLLQSGAFEACVDIRRCRIGGIFPLPIKVKTGAGYELLGEEQFSIEAKPGELSFIPEYSSEKNISKEKTWQRRLLDLSLKNNLLNFRYARDCLRIYSNGLAAFVEKLEKRDSFWLLPADGKEDAPFGGDYQKKTAELFGMELDGGKMRCPKSAGEIAEISQNLIRKARSAEEETGAKTLFLAAGFLKWKREGEKDEKFAPLSLAPVTLKRAKTKGIATSFGEGFEVNTTLLEFLYQEFGVDMRGLEGKNLTPAEIAAAFRKQAASMDGWYVYDDLYIAQFTFARYAMWADVKNHIKAYRSNPLVESLITNSNKLQGNKLSAPKEDDCPFEDVLLPLPSDSAQFSAIAEAANGSTFVLHGPPGTGKSQTIANIIANAAAQGKRVLFVAEKQAALQVVKKRLTGIGIGDFCLELHSGKTADKGQIVQNIENTLALARTAESGRFDETAKKLDALRERLGAPLAALHQKRKLGISVYEGILQCFANASAPELLDIESAFYDGLTAEKLAEYESMLVTVQAAAKECGGVYRSPFAEVRLTSADGGALAAAVCAAEVVLAELKHLKNYLGLLLDTFRQKVSKFTRKKLENSIRIANILKDGSLNGFFTCDKAQFYAFYNASVRYDRETAKWLSFFKTLPDLGKYGETLGDELENWGENYRSSRTVLQVIKRINRCGREQLKEREELGWIKCAYEIERARAEILKNTELSRAFTGFGGINEKKRADFMRPLYELHSLCAETFMDYNADSFNSVCADAAGGALKPLIHGYISAGNAFIKSAEAYLKAIKAEKDVFADADIFEVYSSKCTALIENADMLPAWCLYKATAKKLNECGLTFITDAMERGRISSTQILSSFRKNVYRNFVQTNIPADSELAAFSANVAEENAAELTRLVEEFTAHSRERVRSILISRLPAEDTEGSLALELMAFKRQTKGGMKNLGLRALFSEIPGLLKVVAPCMLMSPATVSQFLPPEAGFFDIVIFDEASQIPTCEAVCSLARAKSAVIVGDPKQMPPTSFFAFTGGDDENPEAEDMESVLEDCLALGIPEKHLVWHYRSKHESLIAFSNAEYYSSRLCTFPSPDEGDSKVRFKYVADGVYDRGASKCNRREAEELVAETVKRLKSGSTSSIGIVTFSTPQQILVERLLSKEIAKAGLEERAYSGEEPLFIKNLENVQGDERDVILFSVCYGPDSEGRISLNFGPLNQFGGWRRLNVAVSRAREEMVVFSSMRYPVIDLSRTTSRGVAGLRDFLEFAEKGRPGVAVKNSDIVINRRSIGKYVAKELAAYGYESRSDLGYSDFRIDCAVCDPADKDRYILAILCDGSTQFSVKDRTVMQAQTLKRSNWNVIRVYSINFFNNPKREIKKIKDMLDKLTGAAKEKEGKDPYAKPYRAVKREVTPAGSDEILSGSLDTELIKTIKAVVSAEEPISVQFLIKRTLALFGIAKYGVRLESKLKELIAKCAFLSEDIGGNTYLFRTSKAADFTKYRVEEEGTLRTQDGDYTPYDVIAAARSVLLGKVSAYFDELIPAVLKKLRVPRATEKLIAFAGACVDEGVRRGLFIKSVSDRVSLA